MKNNKPTYEKRIKRNTMMIFLSVALLCGALAYYVVNAKQSINNQKVNIIKNENILTVTNQLIEKINTAQSYANLYTLSGNNNHLNNFNITLSDISTLNDSLIRISDKDFNTKTLDDIISLLKKKEDNIKKISNQLNTFNPYVEIYSIIDSYQEYENKAIVRKNIQDTIIYKTEKKNFFERLSDVFYPDHSLDSIVLVSKTTIDTINNNETSHLIKDLHSSTKNNSEEYIKRLTTFERQYNNLILSDQNITKELSRLLIVLHKHTLDSVIKEIQVSEIIINRNINFSVSISCIAIITILIFIFLIFNNVKKVTLAHKATEEAKRRTEEIMESRHKLLLSVSHDIKTPLSSILGYLELMQNEYDNDEVASMRNSANHILSLLSNLLNFSKLEQGKETAIVSKFNINEVCDELNAMFKPLATNKQLDFIYNKQLDANTYIKSDALKIKQILSNIISNAIKYSNKGKICFSISREENNMIFNISDEGIGIPKDKIDEIFKPFSRIDNKESLIEGNGFGLFVVRGLVDLLNGNIDVNSKEGRGTTFTISIPVEFSEADKSEESDKNFNPISLNHNLNILVIDDDKTLLNVIQAMLKKIGINSDLCHSSMEFEEILKNINYYDIILTDREMGAFSGLDVLKKIKDIDNEKKVVLMTARSEYNKDIATEKGFDGYLKKPFSIKDLSLLVNKNFDFNSENPSKYQDDFPELCSMFDNDDDAITEILKTFVETTSNNIVTFNDIIDSDNFTEAVKLCHKMCPMFVQLNQSETADFLLKMDKLRGKDESSFPEWKEESINFMNKVDDLLLYMSEKYEIE